MTDPEYSLKPKETIPSKKESNLSKPDKINPSAIKQDSINRKETSDAPFGVDHFGIEGWSEMLLTPALDYNKTVAKISAIEEFIKERIDSEGLKLDKESYSNLIRQMEQEIGLKDFNKPEVRVNRLFALINMIRSHQAAKEKKKSIISLINNKK